MNIYSKRVSQKSYYRVAVEGNYEEIMDIIQKHKPELKSKSKVVEFALQLLLMQCRGEIVRITEHDVARIVLAEKTERERQQKIAEIKKQKDSVFPGRK